MDTIIYIATSSIFLLTSFFMNKSDCERKNSRILSLSSSIIMSLTGVPRTVEYLHSGIKEYSCDEKSFIDDFMNIFFMTYLFLDLTIGYAYYKSKISFFTGYFHHITFIIMNYLIYNSGMSKCSSLMYIIEIPTVYLNLGHFLQDNISISVNSFIMILTFVLCRIIYVVTVLFDVIYKESSDKYIFLPSLYLMLLAHSYWLYEISIKKINLTHLFHTYFSAW